MQSVWNHSDPSEVPYSANQELFRNFFCCFLQQTGSNSVEAVEGKADDVAITIPEFTNAIPALGWVLVIVIPSPVTEDLRDVFDLKL